MPALSSNIVQCTSVWRRLSDYTASKVHCLLFELNHVSCARRANSEVWQPLLV